MDIKITYDQALDAWTLTHKGVHLQTEADAAEWRHTVTKELDKIGPKPVYLLIDIREFQVAAARMADYGGMVKSIAHRFVAVFRYGASVKTQTAVLLQSVLNRYQPNLYPDREAAIRALKQHRTQRRP